MEKVNCKLCKKKKPHGHKGCNEVGAARIQIGETKPLKKTKKIIIKGQEN